MTTIEVMKGIYIAAIREGETNETAEARAVAFYLHRRPGTDIWHGAEALDRMHREIAADAGMNNAA